MPLPSVASLLPCLSRLSLRTPHVGSDAAESKASSSASSSVVPELAEKCVGFVALSRFTRGDANDPIVIFIEELFVHEEVRNRGLAGCLIKGAIGAEEYGPESTAALVVRSNARQQKYARKLYNRLGFDPLPAPPDNLTEPTDRSIPKGARRSVDLDPTPDDEEGEEEEAEQYMEVRIDDLRRTMESACKRAEVHGLDPNTDGEPQNADIFIKAYPDLIEEAKNHHYAPGGDGGDVEALLRAANWGVYRLFVRVTPPRSNAKRSLFSE